MTKNFTQQVTVITEETNGSFPANHNKFSKYFKNIELNFWCCYNIIKQTLDLIF